MDHKIYDSSTQKDELALTAPYYNAILPTRILFKNEGISVFVNALGHIEFFDQEDRSLGFVDVPAAESPELYAHSGQYGQVWCQAQGEEIILRLPVYTWDDCYPHCDGESDRWDRRTVRHFHVVFSCKTRTVSVLDT